MIADNFNLQAYFRRTGYQGTVLPDFETLRLMMRCQLFSVPFENLDVQAGKLVSLVPEDIFMKIVEHGRGGYCYEVNGLFAMALEAAGFIYRMIAARPMTYPQRRPKTHMALVVEIGGAAWLVDLGFGSFGIREPLNLAQTGLEVRQANETFLLDMTGDGAYLLRSFDGDSWRNLYEFTLQPQEWVDFEPANFLNSKHPDSIFVKGLIAVLQQPGGKIVLNGDQFKSVSEEGTEYRTVFPGELPALLRERFSLRYPL
ncbi:MAG: arylamine N-acetyltransferase [Chlorobiaceae bacterium]|nr:arylamine N-acetyltransferase [Chlorobiaceae bacterium]